MSKLEVFTGSGIKLSETTDAAPIAIALAEIGVVFERWPTRNSTGDILIDYAPEIARLKAMGGYRSVDVVAVTPNHPERATMRMKFLSEHTHAEDEVRFFVVGEGLFTLHADGRVWHVLCCAGDLMSVPAGMPHWFDMGEYPNFTAIRMFASSDGWVAAFTGDSIADRFPRYQTASSNANRSA